MASKKETTVRSELFENRICQKFAKTPCSDNDLLAVSQMIAGIPTATVGASLGLEEHEMDAISDSSKSQSKSHLMLQQWRFRNKQNATWISLVECLHALSDSTLMKTIQVYLIQKDSPGFSVAHAYKYGQGHLESAPWILSPLDGGAPIDHTTRRNMRKMEEGFADIVAVVYENIRAVPVEEIHHYLTTLSASREEHIPLFSEEMVKVIKTLSLKRTFVHLNLIGMWGFLNFELLENLATTYGDDGLRAQIQTYTAQIESFLNSTSVYDFCHVWSGRIRRGSLRDHKPLTVKLTGKFLADITRVGQTIAQEFHLNPYVLILGNIECSVPPATEIEATWLIPTPAVAVMMARKTCRASSSILELSVDGNPILQATDSTPEGTPTCSPAPNPTRYYYPEFGCDLAKVTLIYTHNPSKDGYTQIVPDRPGVREVREMLGHDAALRNRIRYHEQLVHKFATFLQHSGIAVAYDQLLYDSSVSNRKMWFEKQIEDSDYIILIITPSFHQFLGDSELPDDEYMFKGNYLYNIIDHPGDLNFLPVFLDEKKNIDLLPPALRHIPSCEIQYPFDVQSQSRQDDLVKLYRLLTKQVSQDVAQQPPHIVHLPEDGVNPGGGVVDDRPVSDADILMLSQNPSFSEHWRSIATSLGVTNTKDCESRGKGDQDEICYQELTAWRNNAEPDQAMLKHLAEAARAVDQRLFEVVHERTCTRS